MHPILTRQIKKFTEAGVDLAPFTKLFEAISRAYSNFDDDRKMVEHSLEVSSKELGEKNEKLVGQLSEIKQSRQHIDKLETDRSEALTILEDLKKAKAAAEESKQNALLNAEKEKKKSVELENLNKYMIGRELKMIELKRENARMKEKLEKLGTVSETSS